MRPITARLIGLAALATVTLLCVRMHAPRIEALLAARATDVAATDAPWASIQADGRDLIVHGESPDEAAALRLREAIESIPGVRSVTFVAGHSGADAARTTTSAASPEPFFVAERAHAGRPVTVSGLVPADVSAELFAAAAPTTEVVVDDASLQTADVHLKGAPELLAATTAAAALLDSGRIEIRDGEITVSGMAIDADTADAIREKLSPFLGLGYNLVMAGGDATAAPPVASAGVMSTEIASAPSAVVTDLATDALALPGGCQQSVNEILADGSIRFRNGSAALRRQSRAVLDRVAAALQHCPAATITITGHTDSRGAADANQRLSEVRAMAVGDYLVSRGIDSGRIRTRGAGEAEPVADNATAAGRARNRRIEIAVKQPSSERSQKR